VVGIVSYLWQQQQKRGLFIQTNLCEEKANKSVSVFAFADGDEEEENPKNLIVY